MQSLKNVQAFIIDMDGVLWKGNNPLPGLVDFFKQLRLHKIRFILATNNASLTQNQYISKLSTMGVDVSAEEILTSSMATAHYLSEQAQPRSTRLFVIGEDGLRRPLIEKGFQLIDSFDANNIADYVVCGLDRQLNWQRMADATLHLHAGAKFIATNADTTLPTERGNVLGNGSILAALEAASNKHPTVLGKPEAIIYQQAIHILNSDTENTIAIGDRLDTDILGAVNTGIQSILLLSGISKQEDIKSVNYSPTWVMPDIRDITHLLQQNNLASNH